MSAVANRVLTAGTPSLWIREPMCSLYCQGCGYPILQRLLCDLMEEMSIGGKAIGCAGAGCVATFFQALNIDAHHGAHGRPPDVATAIKRLRPEAFVFTVQGDGDAIAIGTEPLIQSAARGENITIIMANNGGYGNTGGQMAPTTLLGQVTTTTPEGRKDALHGFPIRVAELMVLLDGVCYSARGSLTSPAHYTRTKKYVKTAFQKQLEGAGLGFVEVLLPCPTNWHLGPLESMKWIEERVMPQFPLGEFKNVAKAGAPKD